MRPTLGDAQQLPFDDDTFDAAVLVTVLGEIPDQEQALREIARVLRPGGRLVVGELFGDPHMVTSGKLRDRAGGAGLGFERRLGNPLAFFERFETPPTESTVEASEPLSSRPAPADTAADSAAVELARPRGSSVCLTGGVRRAVDRARLAGAARDPERRSRWLAAAGTVPFTLGLNYLAKRAVRRGRPQIEGLAPFGRVPGSLSFPSAHAATSFAGAVRLGALAPRPGPRCWRRPR